MGTRVCVDEVFERAKDRSPGLGDQLAIHGITYLYRVAGFVSVRDAQFYRKGHGGAWFDKKGNLTDLYAALACLRGVCGHID